MIVPKHWGHATLNVESGISVAIFLLDKYDSSTPQAYMRSSLEVQANVTDIHDAIVRSVICRSFLPASHHAHIVSTTTTVDVCPAPTKTTCYVR